MTIGAANAYSNSMRGVMQTHLKSKDKLLVAERKVQALMNQNLLFELPGMAPAMMSPLDILEHKRRFDASKVIQKVVRVWLEGNMARQLKKSMARTIAATKIQALVRQLRAYAIVEDRLCQNASNTMQCFFRKIAATNRVNALRAKTADEEWEALFNPKARQADESEGREKAIAVSRRLMWNRFRLAAKSAKLEFIHHADVSYIYIPQIVRHSVLRYTKTRQQLMKHQVGG
jgi:hypothetical protein